MVRGVSATRWWPGRLDRRAAGPSCPSSPRSWTPPSRSSPGWPPALRSSQVRHNVQEYIFWPKHLVFPFPLPENSSLYFWTSPLRLTNFPVFNVMRGMGGQNIIPCSLLCKNWHKNQYLTIKSGKAKCDFCSFQERKALSLNSDKYSYA